MTTIATHSGMFHADDVFAVATLLLVHPDSEVVRTRDNDEIAKADIVVDVGGEYNPATRRFDHHQAGGAGMRGNGIPYASFGLVWKEYGEGLVGAEVRDIIEEKLVIPVDAPDNAITVYQPVFQNIGPYTIQDFFYSFLTYEESGDEYLYDTFMTLVGLAKGILEREIAKAMEKVEGMKKVRQILEETVDKRLIVMDEPLPWERVLVAIPETLFAVYPRREGNWGVKGVPVTMIGFERKKLFPKSWAGKSGEEFRQITGVPDAIFCHRGLFVCAAESKEGALALANIALEQ